MIAFKGTKNFQCKDMKYEVGETYILKKELIICQRGFHFCEKLEDIHSYYHLFNPETVVLKIEVLGDIKSNDDKSVTNKFKVLEVIPKNKYYLYSKNLTKNSIKIICDKFWHRTNVFCGYYLKYKYDTNNNLIYFESSSGFWFKKRYHNKNGNRIYYETSNGNWEKRKFDTNNNLIYFEESDGYWEKHKYDKNNNEIYIENSNGYKCYKKDNYNKE